MHQIIAECYSMDFDAVRQSGYNTLIHAPAPPHGAPANWAITNTKVRSPDTTNTRPTTLSAATMSSAVCVLSGRGPLLVSSLLPLDGLDPGGGSTDLRPVARWTCGLENGSVCDQVYDVRDRAPGGG